MIRHYARKETALPGWGAVQGETAGCLTPVGGWGRIQSGGGLTGQNCNLDCNRQLQPETL